MVPFPTLGFDAVVFRIYNWRFCIHNLHNRPFEIQCTTPTDALPASIRTPHEARAFARKIYSLYPDRLLIPEDEAKRIITDIAAVIRQVARL